MDISASAVMELREKTGLGMMLCKKALIESGVVYNQGAIPNLPPDLAVEVPVVVRSASEGP